MKRAGFYSFYLWLGMALSISVGTCPALAAKSEIQVNAQGLVSFNAGTDSTPLKQILTRLAQKAGVGIFLPEKIPDKSKAAFFQNTSIEDAVGRLLGNTSFAVIYPKNTKAAGLLYFDALDGIQDASGAGILQPEKSAGRQKISKTKNQTIPGGTDPQSTYGHSPEPLARSGISQDNSGVSSTGSNTAGNAVATGTSSRAFSDSSSGSSSSGSSAASGSSDSDGSTNNDGDSSDWLEDNALSYSNDSDDTDKEIARLKYQIEKLNEDIDSGQATQFQETWTSKKDEKYVYNHWDDLAAKKKRLAELTGN